MESASSLSNFEIHIHYQNDGTFYGVYSRNKLIKWIKGGAYAINAGDYDDTGNHQVTTYVKCDAETYSDGFGLSTFQNYSEKS